MFALFYSNDFCLFLALGGLAILGSVIQNNDGFDAPEDGQRKPANARKGRRQREERGLPRDQALRDLARTYLEVQARLWPQLVKDRVVPRLTDANVAKMATAFKRGFLGKEIDAFESNITGAPWSALAAGYIRFSSGKSSPRSLPQQLRLMLEKAHQNGHFIAWQHVFADASITGTTAARSGYELAETALQVADHGIEVIYVDELGRASRDMVETMLLGRLVERLHKRLIGVSDGFDTEMPMWKTVLSIFGALQEWSIDQLRAKVNRGMDDAFRRGTNTGLPAIGYKVTPAVDAQGNPIFGKDGERLNMLVVHEEAAPYVRLVFELYADKG
jgi:DNA invertase Pin-like site-specific DNA recombinase